MLEKIHLAINDSYKLRCHEINDVLTEDPIAATDKGIDDKIVFLCGEQKIEIRMKIIQMLSPVVRKLLGEELCSHSHARTEGQKYFISLDAEIDPEAVERIFNTRVDEDVRMSQHQLQQFKTFVQMLQISSRWFSLQELRRIHDRFADRPCPRSGLFQSGLPEATLEQHPPTISF